MRSVSKQSLDDSFLKYTRSKPHRLCSRRKNNQWRLSCLPTGRVLRLVEEKMNLREKRAFPLRLCTVAHMCSCYGEICRSPYFLDLAPRDYFLLANLKKWSGGKEFPTIKCFLKQMPNLRNSKIVLFVRFQLQKHVEWTVWSSKDYVGEWKDFFPTSPSFIHQITFSFTHPRSQLFSQKRLVEHLDFDIGWGLTLLDDNKHPYSKVSMK